MAVRPGCRTRSSSRRWSDRRAVSPSSAKDSTGAQDNENPIGRDGPRAGAWPPLAVTPPLSGAARAPRLVVVATHPIQHFVPFYRALAQQDWLDLHVLFGAKVGINQYHDAEMGRAIRWNMDLLSGYPHSFLPGADDVREIGPRSPDSPDLLQELDRLAPDVLLLYGYYQANAWRALRWARTHRVPALMISDSELKQQRSSSKRVLRRLSLPWVLRRYAGFLTVGDENERFYTSFGVPRAKLFRSPFTIDEVTYRTVLERKAEARAEVRRRFAVPDDAVLFLQVGKLSERKRPLDGMDALGRLEKDIAIRLLLAGDGGLMEAVKERAAADDRIIPAGFINLDELPQLYAASDILLHCSEADPHPLVCSEAAICGLPMLLSDRIGAVGPTDVARPGENAVIYPCGDIAALADSMRRLATNNDLRQRMSAASRAIFAEVDVNASLEGLRQAMAAVMERRPE